MASGREKRIALLNPGKCGGCRESRARGMSNRVGTIRTAEVEPVPTPESEIADLGSDDHTVHRHFN